MRTFIPINTTKDDVLQFIEQATIIQLSNNSFQNF